jgi:hypothetical protein
MLYFRSTKGQLLQGSMNWAGCQNNPINLNFNLEKSLENFGKKSADKM